jgi:hypothetical protein
MKTGAPARACECVTFILWTFWKEVLIKECASVPEYHVVWCAHEHVATVTPANECHHFGLGSKLVLANIRWYQDIGAATKNTEVLH